jgi:hypothetical protein
MLCWILAGAAACGQGVSKPPLQHFICHTGFTAEQCQLRMTILRKVLDRYHSDRLGQWDWVLVRTNDWRALLSGRGFDTASPAFTYLPRNETFFDEALTIRDSVRGVELTKLWRMSVEDLLDKAVRHELGHALCRETDELKARLLEDEFRFGAPVVCKGRKSKVRETERID